MAQLHESAVGLRIIGDDLAPDEISRQLGCLPTFAQLKGEAIVGERSGQTRVAKCGMWRLRAQPREPEDLNGQIAEILGQLSDDLDVWKAISDRYSVDLFCGLFMDGSNEGLSVSASSLFALGARGIQLSLDLYGPGSSASA